LRRSRPVARISCNFTLLLSPIGSSSMSCVGAGQMTEMTETHRQQPWGLCTLCCCCNLRMPNAAMLLLPAVAGDNRRACGRAVCALTLTVCCAPHLRSQYRLLQALQLQDCSTGCLDAKLHAQQNNAKQHTQQASLLC
jgi:hypothetical protein